MAQTPNTMGTPPEAIALAHPVTLATYARYADAQRAVDYLSDEKFPVQNCMIVGTDLRQLERVTGRMTQQKAALGGLLSGAWFGLFIGLIMSMFDGQGLQTVITTVLFGALFGLVWAMIGYAMTRGRRDFTSVTTVVATRYEVLVEGSLQAQARQVLSGLPNNGLHQAAAPGERYWDQARQEWVDPSAQPQQPQQADGAPWGQSPQPGSPAGGASRVERPEDPTPRA